MLAQINSGLNWNLNGILSSTVNYYYEWQTTMAVRDRIRKWIRKINLQNNIQVFGCLSQCWFNYYEGKEQYQTNHTLPRKGHALKTSHLNKNDFYCVFMKLFCPCHKMLSSKHLILHSTEVTEVWNDMRLNKWWQILFLFLEGNLPSNERWCKTQGNTASEPLGRKFIFRKENDSEHKAKSLKQLKNKINVLQQPS